MSLSESVDRLLPFARAVIEASMELEKYEPLQAALEERLTWLKGEVAKTEAQRTAAVDEVADQKVELAKARLGVKAAEERARQIIADAEVEASGRKADIDREIASAKDTEARRLQRIHDDLIAKIDKLQARFADLDQQVKDKTAEHVSISGELRALKEKFG